MEGSRLSGKRSESSGGISLEKANDIEVDLFLQLGCRLISLLGGGVN